MKLSNPLRQVRGATPPQGATTQSGTQSGLAGAGSTGARRGNQPRPTTVSSSAALRGRALLDKLRPRVQNVVEQQKGLLQTQLAAVAVRHLRSLKGGLHGDTSTEDLLRAAANSGVEEGATHGDETQKDNVKYFTEAIVRTSGAVGGALTSKGQKLGEEEAQKHERALREAGEQAVPAQDDVGKEAQRRGIRAATKAVAAERAVLFKGDARDSLARTIQDNAGALLDGLATEARGRARERAEKEARLRGEVDTAVGDAAKEPVDKAIDDIRAGTTRYLAHKLGASSAHWWRSKEVRAFRGSLKEAARAQATKDVDAELSKHTKLGAMRKKYVAMDAKRRVYRAAKRPVREEVTAIAEKAAEKLTNQSDARATLRTVATRAAWGRLRLNKQDEKGAKKDARRAVQKAKRGEARKVQAEAKAWKDCVLGKHDRAHTSAAAGTTPGQTAVEAPTMPKIKEAVQQKTRDDQVGAKAVKASIEASTIDQGLGKIGHLVDLAAPNPGDEISVDVELRIPIPNTPTFLAMGFSGAAARGLDSLTAGTNRALPSTAVEVEADLRFGAGVEFVLGEGSATVGLFQRAGGRTTERAMTAFSYGAYRRLASGPARKLADLWGGPGKGTNMGRVERSERWAAMVEEELFAQDEEAFAEVGQAGSLKAESSKPAKMLGMKGELGARLERLRRFDRETLAEAGYLHKSTSGGSSSYGVVDFTDEAAAKKRRDKAKKIEASRNLTVAASIERDVVGHPTSFSGELSFEDRQNWEFSVEAALPLAAGQGAGKVEQIIAGLGAAALALMQMLHGRKERARASRSGKTRGAGRALQALEGFDTAFLGLQQKGATQLANAVGHKTQGDASFDLAVKFVLGKAGGAWVTEVVLSQKSAHSVELEVGNVGLSVEVERSRRLGARGYDGSAAPSERVHGDLMGFRTRG